MIITAHGQACRACRPGSPRPGRRGYADTKLHEHPQLQQLRKPHWLPALSHKRLHPMACSSTALCYRRKQRNRHRRNRSPRAPAGTAPRRSRCSPPPRRCPRPRRTAPYRSACTAAARRWPGCGRRCPRRGTWPRGRREEISSTARRGYDVFSRLCASMLVLKVCRPWPHRPAAQAAQPTTAVLPWRPAAQRSHAALPAAACLARGGEVMFTRACVFHQ
jgi:hypothetical protein